MSPQITRHQDSILLTVYYIHLPVHAQAEIQQNKESLNTKGNLDDFNKSPIQY